jgi:putative ABC transport system permease protein
LAPSSQTIFFSRLLDSLRALPGTEAVAAVSNLPASNVPNARSSFVIERRPPQSPSEMPSADLQTVGGALFPLLRVPILRGRDLLESDVGGSMPAIVVSEAMARTYWPNENPLGQRIRLGSWKEDGPWWTIVGVAGDIRQNWFDPTPRAIAYVSVRQRPVRTMTVMVRTANDPRALVQPLKDHLVRIDSTLPMSEIATLRDEVDDSLAPLRIIGALLVTFALVTFALAGIGVYGVVTGTVARQTREFGIRMTLGAGPSRIQAEVLGETLRVVSWSAAIGIPVSMAVQSLGASTLYGLVTMSAATPIAATGSVLLLSLIAALVPARRAAALDPAVALRAGDSQW